jgi:hypothetical protein
MYAMKDKNIFVWKVCVGLKSEGGRERGRGGGRGGGRGTNSQRHREGRLNYKKGKNTHNFMHSHGYFDPLQEFTLFDAGLSVGGLAGLVTYAENFSFLHESVSVCVPGKQLMWKARALLQTEKGASTSHSARIFLSSL